MSALYPIWAAVIAVLCLGCAFTDLVWRRIPNRLIVVLASVELLCFGWAASQHGWRSLIEYDVGTGFLAALGVLLVGIVLFLRSIVGAGDVKLAACLCPWMGADAVEFVLAFSLFGGFLVFLLPVIRGVERRIGTWVLAWEAKSDKRSLRMPAVYGDDARLKNGLPYAIAIAAAAIAVIAFQLPLGH